jgi:oligosaccharide 4-alpha-D-glucosyltransferase
MPVFVKEGSFVPMFKSKEPVKNTGEYTGREIGIKYYPSTRKSTYTLYDDDGHTKNTLEKGNYELIRFEGQQKNNSITILVEPGNKKLLQTRTFLLELPAGFEMKNAKVNGVATKIADQKIRLNYTGKNLKIEIAFK